MAVLPDSSMTQASSGSRGAGQGRSRQRCGLALPEFGRAVGGSHPPGTGIWAGHGVRGDTQAGRPQPKSVRQCNRALARTASPSSL